MMAEISRVVRGRRLDIEYRGNCVGVCGNWDICVVFNKVLCCCELKLVATVIT